MRVYRILQRLMGAGIVVLVTSLAAWAVDATSDTWLNVRSGPGTGYSVVDTLHPGEEIDVQSCQSDGWCRITHSGPNGWVNSDYISPIAPGGSGPDCRFQLTIDGSGPHLSIVCGSGGGGGGVFPPPPPPPPPPLPATRACFYVGPNYSGAQFCRPPGATNTLPTPLNDAFTSVRVYGGAQAQLCVNPNFGGFCRVITHNTPLLGPVINDRASSVRVFAAAPPPPPTPLPLSIVSDGLFSLPATRRMNLDTGTMGGPGADILYRNIATGRWLTPLNGARLARGAGTNRGYAGCSAETWSGAPLPFAALSVGTYVCVRTNQGRISQFRVNSYSGLTMNFGYTTWGP